MDHGVCKYVLELRELDGNMMTLEELACVGMCIYGHVMMVC